MSVTVKINIPGQPTHIHTITTTEAKIEAKKIQQERDHLSTADFSNTNPPVSKKRKAEELTSANADGLVPSSVADRAQGPGKDPTSRFSYVYTGKHDHGELYPKPIYTMIHPVLHLEANRLLLEAGV